jgi:hypothetical protein
MKHTRKETQPTWKRKQQYEFSIKMAFGSMVGMTLIITYLIIMNIIG